MNSFGFADVVVRWVKTYFTGQVSKVHVLRTIPIHSGVLLGYMIGLKCIEALTLLFADDVSYCRRNLSIILREVLWVFLPQWVWRPHPCVKISQRSKCSGSQCILSSAQCTQSENKARRLIFMIRRLFQEILLSHPTGAEGFDLMPPGMPACSPNPVAGINTD